MASRNKSRVSQNWPTLGTILSTWWDSWESRNTTRQCERSGVPHHSSDAESPKTGCRSFLLATHFWSLTMELGCQKMHPVLTLSAGGHNKSSRKSARSAYHLPPLTWVCITAGDSLIPRTITTREPGKYSLGFLAPATQVGTRALVSHVHQRSYGGNSSFFYKRDWWAQFQHISNPLVNTEGELVSQALRQRCHPSPVIWGIAYGI